MTKLALLLILLLELASWLVLSSNWPTTSQLLVFSALHAVAVYLAVRLLMHFFPDKYRQQKASTRLTLFSLGFFIPFLGLLGLFAAILWGIGHEQEEKIENIQRIAIPELPYRPLQVTEQPRYGQAGLVSVLRNAPSPEKRLRAVMATRQLNDYDAIQVLRVALKDPVDDVRLLAYSMVDAKEKTINQQIERTRRKLASAIAIEKANLHSRLANLFWELGYLELAQGEVLKYTLLQARENLDAALTIDASNASNLLQLGKVLLRLAQYEQADAAFARTRELGMNKDAVLPYQAEVAFIRGDFVSVRAQLSELSPSARNLAHLDQVVKYWS